MTKRWLIGGGVWAVVAALAFLFLNAVLAAFVVIIGATVVVVAALAADWDKHSTFEERELARARKRKAKWERNAGARAKDRALWEAHRARKAQR